MKMCWNERVVNEVTERLVISYHFIHLPCFVWLAACLSLLIPFRDISCPATQLVKIRNQLGSYLLKTISAAPKNCINAL